MSLIQKKSDTLLLYNQENICLEEYLGKPCFTNISAKPERLKSYMDFIFLYKVKGYS